MENGHWTTRANRERTHAAWHASSGLAMQILERQSDIYGNLNPNALSKIRQHCEEWDEWSLQYSQDDSGI